jgi:hypothetical protein
MDEYHWADRFRELYDKAVEQYRGGNRAPSSCFNKAETAFLAAIGHSAQELYDFAEDAVKYGAPSFGTALLIASARRDYFLVIQKGKPSRRTITMDGLPAKEAAVDGITWLPRIIAKAHAKLKGEMPAELMFGCAGDRRFLESVNIHPSDFLRYVWAAGDNDRKVVAYVKKQAGRA